MSAEPISELFYSILHKRISSVYTSAFATRMHSSRMRTARSSSRQLGGCLPQCMLGYTPQVWAWRLPWVWAWRTPPGLGLENPPRSGPGDPTRCGPGCIPACLAGFQAHTQGELEGSPGGYPGLHLRGLQAHTQGGSPPGDLQGMLGYHLQGMLGYHPPPWTDRQV